jgi:hypothetical protein
LVASRDGVVF